METRLQVAGEPPTEILILSSRLIFVLAVIAFFLKRWGDVFIVTSQALCAIWFHSSRNLISYYADQFSMYLLALHTLLLARTSQVTPYLFVLGFGYMLVLYSYGQRNRCFCFDSDINIANRYHASIHILGITIYGSSMILFLDYEAGGIFDLFQALISASESGKA